MVAPAPAPGPATPATVRVEGLSLHAHHGVTADEQALGQRFEFDVEVDVDDCAACTTDDVADAVAYEAVAAVVTEVATNFRFSLLEALADAVCCELVAEFPVARARVTVHKPAPPMAHAVRRVSVSVARTREHAAHAH